MLQTTLGHFSPEEEDREHLDKLILEYKLLRISAEDILLAKSQSNTEFIVIFLHLVSLIVG